MGQRNYFTTFNAVFFSCFIPLAQANPSINRNGIKSVAYKETPRTSLKGRTR